MKRDVFISYSRRNYDAVVDIKRQVDAATGTECWMDLNAIESGADMFTQDIVDGINNCKVLLFMLSSHSQNSEYALDELRFAKKKKKKVVFVNIDGCEMNDIFDFKYGGRDIIDWNDTPQREKLLRDIPSWIGSTGGVSNTSVVQPSVPKVAVPAVPENRDKVFNVGGVEFKMVYVEGGTFMMGATDEQGSDAFKNEKPAHKVILSSYFIGETVVTQALWEAVMGNNLSHLLMDDNLPVNKVSWYDVQEFMKKLNVLTGHTFRLPTEAEWEYAARGGRKSEGYFYSGSDNVDEVAWYYKNSVLRRHPVKSKMANELGLYDMSGNVWEWCSDWYGMYGSTAQIDPTGPDKGSSRVDRGGGCGSKAYSCCVFERRSTKPEDSNRNLGFRLVLTAS